MSEHLMVSEETAQRLAAHAKPFEPLNAVVNRLIDHYEQGACVSSAKTEQVVEPRVAQPTLAIVREQGQNAEAAKETAPAPTSSKTDVVVTYNKAHIADFSKPENVTIQNEPMNPREYGSWNMVLNKMLELALSKYPYEDVVKGLPITTGQGSANFTEPKRILPNADFFRRNASSGNAIKAITTLSNRYNIPVTADIRWNPSSDLHGRRGVLSCELPKGVTETSDHVMTKHSPEYTGPISHTELVGTLMVNASVDGESLPMERMSWSGLMEKIVETAWMLSDCKTIRDLTNLNIEDGARKRGQKNYTYLKGIDVTFKNAPSSKVAQVAEVLCEHLPMSVACEFEWKPNTLHPGKRGKLAYAHKKAAKVAQ